MDYAVYLLFMCLSTHNTSVYFFFRDIFIEVFTVFKNMASNLNDSNFTLIGTNHHYINVFYYKPFNNYCINVCILSMNKQI